MIIYEIVVSTWGSVLRTEPEPGSTVSVRENRLESSRAFDKARARFFLDSDLAGEEAVLPTEEVAHAFRSRRMQPGQRVELFNGRGSVRGGELAGSPSRATVRFTEPLRTYPPSRPRLTVAVSPPRGDRMRFLVEKLAELGADRLIPTFFKRSLDTGRKPGANQEARWRRVAVEAAKQSGRPHLMTVEKARTVDAVADELEGGKQAILLHLCDEAQPLADLISGSKGFAEKILLLVGPEGGLTPEEAAQCVQWGALPAEMGSHILRIETAALAAAALIRLLAGDDHGTGKP